MTKIRENPFIYSDTKEPMEIGDICYYYSSTLSTKGSRRFKIIDLVRDDVLVKEVNFNTLEIEGQAISLHPHFFFKDTDL